MKEYHEEEEKIREYWREKRKEGESDKEIRGVTKVLISRHFHY